MNTVIEASIEDLWDEMWLRKRNAGKIIWKTKDGRKIPIKDMSDEHLMNTIRMLERNEELRDRICDFDAFLE